MTTHAIRNRIVGHGVATPSEITVSTVRFDFRDFGEKWIPLQISNTDERYEVSTWGWVRFSTRNEDGLTYTTVRRRAHSRGYWRVSLRIGGKAQSFLVHRLVAFAFLGPSPDGMEVNHKNGNKQNNSRRNLEYVTRSQNVQHAMRTGLLKLKGSDNPRAKLAEDDVRAIRAAYTVGGYRMGGLGYKALAKQYGVNWSVIRNIIKGQRWGWMS